MSRQTSYPAHPAPRRVVPPGSSEQPETPVQACPFCAADVDLRCFCADRCYLAIYNIAPVLPGHALVIPRRHVCSLLDLSDGETRELFTFARSVTRLLVRAFAADGFDWTIQDGTAAGQTVPHLHLHVIPRIAGDLPQPGDWYPALRAREQAPIDSEARPRLSPQEHARITAHLRALAESEG